MERRTAGQTDTTDIIMLATNVGYIPRYGLISLCLMMLAKELKPNRKLLPDHLSFILHGALVGAGSLWPNKWARAKRN
jgi:hypothetical protein